MESGSEGRQYRSFVIASLHYARPIISPGGLSYKQKLRRTSTLIIEDHPATRQSLARLLTLLGHEVESAGTIEEGLAKLAWEPGCILLDLMLPDGSGLVILEHIRAAHLAVKVAVTAATYDPTLVAKLATLHPDAVFDKPVDLEGLCGWLGSTPPWKPLVATLSPVGRQLNHEIK